MAEINYFNYYNEMAKTFISSILDYPAIPIESCGNKSPKCGVRRISKYLCMCHPVTSDKGWNDAPFRVNITNKYSNLKLSKDTVLNVLTKALENVKSMNSIEDDSVKLFIVNPNYTQHSNGCGEELCFDMLLVSCNEKSECSRDAVQIVTTTGDVNLFEQLSVDKCGLFPLATVYLEFVKLFGMICNDLESGGIR